MDTAIQIASHANITRQKMYKFPISYTNPPTIITNTNENISRVYKRTITDADINFYNSYDKNSGTTTDVYIMSIGF